MQLKLQFYNKLLHEVKKTNKNNNNILLLEKQLGHLAINNTEKVYQTSENDNFEDFRTVNIIPVYESFLGMLKEYYGNETLFYTKNVPEDQIFNDYCKDCLSDKSNFHICNDDYWNFHLVFLKYPKLE